MNKVEILNGLLGGDLGEALARAAAEKAELKPATMVQVRPLLEGTGQKFAIGDIVTLREAFKDSYRYPKADEKVIVTQVLDQPFRSGSTNSAEAGSLADIGLAFYEEDGGRIVEFLQDSRHYVKVGSIYDPIELPSGEKLPVE